MRRKNSLIFQPCILILFILIISGYKAVAQNDSLQQQTIDIYNVYQPTLRAAAKLNLTATLPNVDTTRPGMVYSIPSQNLNFTYSPVPLRPLAMGIDTSYGARYNNFLKAGFGNYSTPFISLGLSNGGGQPFQYGLYFNHLSSKGSLENQAFSNDDLMVHGKYLSNTHEVHGSVSYQRNGLHYYGYDHDTIKLDKKDIKQVYNTLSVKAGLSNTTENTLKINYQPDIELTNFFDNRNRRESTFRLNLPVQKVIVKDIFLTADFLADFSNYTDDNNSYKNTLASIHPAVVISKPTFMLHAGVNPTWTNDGFFLLPDIVNETDLIKDKLILSSGWISYFDKNSYQNLAKENPFINGYNNPLNTRIEEKYTGIKGTINNHFTYNTKFAVINYSDRPLFANDSAYGNTFVVINEEELKAYQLHAEVGYVAGEKFQVKLSGSWYNYFKEKTEDKPWGLRPFVADLYGQFTIGEKFHFSADIYALSGSFYKDKNGIARKTQGALDVNAGASYEITRQFNLWFNANNILNSQYERWHNYPSLGLNVLGGIMIKF